MVRLPLVTSLALAAVVTAGIPVAAATLEYTFTVPYQARPAAPIGAVGAGAGGTRPTSMSVTCAIGPASLGYSTATNGATNATGSGTTSNLPLGQGRATVVVTVDAQPRGDITGKPVANGAGTILQPTQPSGYYTCWATFAGGQTPVNFLQTTAMPKSALAGNAKATVDSWNIAQ